MGSMKVVNYAGARMANRTEAAEKLSEQLSDYEDNDQLVVLGVPRGGVIVADTNDEVMEIIEEHSRVESKNIS